jgi:hypothetical protein
METLTWKRSATEGRTSVIRYTLLLPLPYHPPFNILGTVSHNEGDEKAVGYYSTRFIENDKLIVLSEARTFGSVLNAKRWVRDELRRIVREL